jgi:hypothetical protein
LQSALSCDSVIETSLTVNPTYFTQVSATICDDTVYTFNGNSYNQTGVYLDTLPSTLSCDSVIETNLTLNLTYFTQVSYTICDDEVYSFNGHSYNQTGVYLDTLQSALSCDSVIETNLTVNPTHFTQVSATICDDEVYTFNGNIYSQAGIFLDTIQSSLSCDSVIETNLTVNPTFDTNLSVHVCNGQSYTTVGGQLVSVAGTYNDTLSTTNGCDSVVKTQLYLDIITTTHLRDTICGNETYTTVGGQLVKYADTYIDTLSSWVGCDSIVETELFVFELENFKAMKGKDRVKLNDTEQYSIDDYPTYNYFWEAEGGNIVGSWLNSFVQVNWPDTNGGIVKVIAVDDYNICEHKDSLLIEIKKVTSIDNLANNDVFNFEIIPNPNNGLFDLNIHNLQDEKATVVVYSLKGKMLMQKEHLKRHGSSLSMDLNLAQGSYLIKFISDS